jgi:hypothetical protein
MGGKSSSESTTSQTQKTTPWGPASPALTGLVGHLSAINPNLTAAETTALNALQGNASAGNPYAGRINTVADNFLGGGPDRTAMVSDAYNSYRTALEPTARGDYVDPSNNSELMKFVGLAGDDAAKRINGIFAGAGRDFSGAHMAALGKGVASATTPILYDAYNRARADQLGAIDKTYGAETASAGLLSGLDQTKLGNQQAGIGVATEAMKAQDSPFMQTLMLEAQRRGIPMQNITGLLGALAPIAEAFGTKTGTAKSTGTQTMSGAQQFATIAQGLGSLFGGGQQKPQPTSMWG